METTEINKLAAMIRKILSDKESDIRDNLPMAEENVALYGFPSDKFYIANLIRQGIPYSVFSMVHDMVPFTDQDWANLLDMSTKTLFRYKQSQKKFKSIHSEKILELAEVTLIGLDVFGDISKFKQWFITPNFALGNFKPFDLVTDSYGKDLVITELSNINHGIFA